MFNYEFKIDLNHLQELNIDSFKTIINESKKHSKRMVVLQLNNISTLSPSVSNCFCEFTINTSIELKGLNKLELKTAIGLSRFKGLLVLGNVHIDLDALQMLMLHKGALEFGRIENITNNEAGILKNYNGNVLDLSALQQLQQDTAAELAQYKGEYLSLNGLRELSPDAADAISLYKGHLFMDGIETLSFESMEKLCQHAFKMNLDGLLSIGREEAKLLAAKGGKHLSLRGITSISDEALEEFSLKKRTVVLSSRIKMSDWARKKSLREGLVEFSNSLV